MVLARLLSSLLFSTSCWGFSDVRKPRDIDAELKALADKARGLKAQRIMQLGELVTVTGADALDLEALAGALLAVVQRSKTAETTEAWRREGAAFFQKRSRRKDAGGADGGSEQGGAAHGSGGATG